MFNIAACLDLNNFEYWSWYEDTSKIIKHFFLVLAVFKIGVPMFPTVLACSLAVCSIFSIILQVVDFPFVPVIEITSRSLLISKNKSKSEIIFFMFFFKKFFILHL